MKKRYLATACGLVLAFTAATYVLALSDDKQEKDAGKTYTPTVDEWLQVYLNSNFGRHDSQRFIGFIVMPAEKKISMMTHIYENHPRDRQDPGHRQKLKMEIDMFEAQAKAYAKRFGYELKREKMSAS